MQQTQKDAREMKIYNKNFSGVGKKRGAGCGEVATGKRRGVFAG